MESGKGQKDRKKPEYKLGERNLNVKSDMEFIDKLIKDLRIEAQPGVRGVVLDIAYTLARDKLVEAMRFAKLSNRTNITVDDLKMVHMEEVEELRKSARTLKNVEVSQEILPKPCVEKGLLLPNWRNCQVGVTPELYVPQKKCPPTRVIAARPNILRRPPKTPPVVPKVQAQPVVPKVQAQLVVPKVQAQLVVPKVQAQPVVPKAQPVVPKAQPVVPVPPLRKTGLPRINIIPATCRGLPRINIIPATCRGPRTVVAAPPKASSDGSKPSVGTPPIPKKSRPN